MELNVFIKKFLPDFNNRQTKYFHDNDGNGIMFDCKNFPEALQNFADMICEKQRLDIYYMTKESFFDHKNKIDILLDIFNSEQPKIEDL